MPCTDGRSEYEERLELRAKIDNLTNMLCETCKRGLPTEEARAWFERHQEQDRRAAAWAAGEAERTLAWKRQRVAEAEERLRRAKQDLDL